MPRSSNKRSGNNSSSGDSSSGDSNLGKETPAPAPTTKPARLANRTSNYSPDEEDTMLFLRMPEDGAILGSLRSPAPSVSSVSADSASSNILSPDVLGGPSGLTVPSLYLKIGEIENGQSVDNPVYLQCTGEQEDYTCTLQITLGRASPRQFFDNCSDNPFLNSAGEVSVFVAPKDEQLRDLLMKAQAALPELRALATADFLTRRHGQSLQESLHSDEALQLWRADVAPFAPYHKSCRQALQLVDQILEVRGFGRYMESEGYRRHFQPPSSPSPPASSSPKVTEDGDGRYGR